MSKEELKRGAIIFLRDTKEIYETDLGRLEKVFETGVLGNDVEWFEKRRTENKELIEVVTYLLDLVKKEKK